MLFLTWLACTSATDEVAADTGPSAFPSFLGEGLRGLDLTELAVYQGLKTRVMRDLEAAKGDQPPIIAGRPALVRAFVEPQSDWTDRPVQGLLAVQRGGELAVFETVQEIDQASTDGDLESTLNFQVPAAWIQDDTVLSISLHEGDPTAGPGAGDADRSRWSGPLQVTASGSIVIKVFPVKYKADGSGRLPVIDDEQIQLIRDTTFAMYPVTDVDIQVQENMPWDYDILADGTGWDRLLSQIAIMRAAATDEPDNVYYYGLFKPETSIEEYCEWGCVLGLSLLGGPADVWSRASIGLGFKGATTAETLVHEVGHAHGREHAPCGLYGQPTDPGYPHPNAELGTWGYDLVTGELKAPTRFVDMMSYCSPIWISDYNYGELLTRVQKLTPDADVLAPPPQRRAYRAARVDAAGHLTDLGAFPLAQAPTGAPRALQVGLGGQTQRVEGTFVPYDHLPGGWVLYPDVGLPDALGWADEP